ncbi:tRNA lysidine(34) synthetase TilS [Skermanella pratensis]|uniref:tRNA lysidine(34) synthetase TilS n=1 Tax=Skermanella pratensis TaxID=2233999 RepID=UPI0013012464|nr:tRNA lysidine(34) synthetase TilS [Skermanella pratensis]
MTHDVSGEFPGLMDRLGPFEPRPRVAVGVSGGPDSLALCLLLKAWADRSGGSLLALTVDHGLRHNAAEEAVQVGSWLAARGIAHDVLRWEGSKPASGIQAAARDARQRLLADRCRSEGILHLVLAHHLEDQAETTLLRFAKGSGPDGLAGMSPLRETGAVRILRPLLGMPRARLKAVLEAAGQPWVEDPSNRSAAFARVRLRAMADTLAGRAGRRPMPRTRPAAPGGPARRWKSRPRSCSHGRPRCGRRDASCCAPSWSGRPPTIWRCAPWAAASLRLEAPGTNPAARRSNGSTGPFRTVLRRAGRPWADAGSCRAGTAGSWSRGSRGPRSSASPSAAERPFAGTDGSW